MTLRLEPAICRQLVRIDSPLELLSDHLPVEQTAPSRAELTRAFTGAMDGNVSQARQLRGAWTRIAREMTDCLAQDPELSADISAGALLPKLSMLPLLETVYSDVFAALYDWALIGIREQIADPVPYPVAANLDDIAMVKFMQATAMAAADEVAPVTRMKSTFGVSNDELGAYLGVTGSAIGQYERGETVPKAATANKLGRVLRLATVFTETVKPDVIHALFSSRPIPLLGGETYRAALAEGFDVDVLIDIVGRAAGRRPETDAGARYLASARAAAAIAQFERTRLVEDGVADGGGVSDGVGVSDAVARTVGARASRAAAPPPAAATAASKTTHQDSDDARGTSLAEARWSKSGRYIAAKPSTSARSDRRKSASAANVAAPAKGRSRKDKS